MECDVDDVVRSGRAKRRALTGTMIMLVNFAAEREEYDPERRVRHARADTDGVTLSRRIALFLLAFGVWSWLLWPTFFRNIWASDRSWSAGSPTAYLVVHLVIAVVSLLLGTIIGVLGWRGYRASRS